MKFRILGPLEVRAENGEIALGGRKPRGILAMLLLQANRPVSSERLAAGLWGEDVPPASVKTIQVHVSRLRKALGDTASLETTSAGYRLIVDPDELDAECFAQRVEDARRAHELEQFDRAAALFREALSLWRGPALGDLAFEPFAPMEIARLEEQRLAAIEARVATDLSAGRHEEIVAELQRLVAQHPTRERLSAHLMLALYRSGRQSEALEAYQTLRGVLVTEVGVEPGPGLRELQEAVLQQEPWLDVVKPVGREPNLDQQVPLPSGLHQQILERVASLELDDDAAGLTSSPSSDRLALRSSLPSRLRVRSPWEFVGRARERAQLDRALEPGATESRTVLVSGEPGIGKTRLVSEYATRAHLHGVLILAGRCDSDLGLPYQPFVEVLGELLPRLTDEAIDRHLQRHGPVIGCIVPAMLERARLPTSQWPADIDSAHHRLLLAVGDLLTEQATRGPLALVLEDLHWADDATVRLLRHVLTMPTADRIGIIGTYRSTELEGRPLAGLLPDLHREPDVTRIELGGLSEPDILALLQQASLASSDDGHSERARRLRRGTAGNPFFVLQLLQADAERGGEPEASYRWTPSDQELPIAVRETIIARVANVGGLATDILAAAAVIGDEFELDVLRRLTAADDEELTRVIETAIDVQLLVDPPEPRSPLQFVHALVPQVLSAELSAVRRHSLHRATAVTLESLYGQESAAHVAALAHHWRCGWHPRDLDRAIECARLAADLAVERLAPADAAHGYGDALELLEHQPDPSASDRCELLIRRGEAQRQAGDAGFRDTLLTAARLAGELGDADRLVRAVLANTRGFTSATGEIDLERIAMLDAALGTVGSGDSATHARLLAAKSVEMAFCGDFERPRRLSEQALGMARRAGDQTTLARVLSNRFFAVWTPDTLAARMRESSEGLTVCERIGDPIALTQALHWHANACLESGDMRGARASAARGLEVAERTREPTVMWQAAYTEANLALVAGQLEEAERLAAVALELSQRSAQPDGLAVFGAQLSYLRFAQGRLHELLPLLEQILAEHSGITGFRALLALAHCEHDDPDQARAVMRKDAASRFADLAYDVTWLSVVCIYAHVSARVGDRESASVLYRMLEPWREQVAVSVVAWGCVAHFRGMLAATLDDKVAALEDLRLAAAVHERMSAPRWLAQTELEIRRVTHGAASPGAGSVTGTA